MWSLFAQGRPGEFLYCFKPHLAKLHYRHHSLDLLTGKKNPGGIATFLESLHQTPLNARFAKPKVLHLTYELGHLLQGLPQLVPGHLPLAVEIEYLKARRTTLGELWKHSMVAPRLKFQQVPSWEEYEKAFKKIQQELWQGNCYQVNLTAPFYLSWRSAYRPSDFIRHLWSDTSRVGAYAHATWLSTMGKLLLSNSPECLVQRRGGDRGTELYSMPIKGTSALSSGDDWEQSWCLLRSSRKESGELNMITDLVRNDLSRIAEPRARVVAKRRPLRVPGLLHQYALVSCEVPETTSWERVLASLFPGGSVTGAPKRRVLEIIQQVESEPRGHYCGSTWLAFQDTLAASINIRTAELDWGPREMRYGAGGGITLLSEAQAEFTEMLRKSESFLSPFLPASSLFKTK